MIPEFSTLARPATLAALFLTATPAMAQETAQQVYDAYFVAYSGGQAAETYPEYIAGITLDDQVAKVQKDEPELAGKWSEADTRAAVAEFGAPTRAPYKALVMRRLIGSLRVSDAKAATLLAADPAAFKAITCVSARPGRTADDWAACTGDGARALTADEQALATRAVSALNAAIAGPDLNSATVGIVCHTLDRFSDRISGDGVTRKYSMTISVTDEDALSCERAKPRYAALLGHDAYLKLEPALIFSSDKED